MKRIIVFSGLIFLILTGCDFVQQDININSQAINNDKSFDSEKTTTDTKDEGIDESTTKETIEPFYNEGDNEVDSVKKRAYLKIKTPGEFIRSDNDAYYLYGTTSNNCSAIAVKAVNEYAGMEDIYKLENYKYGDTLFEYGIREDWGNLDFGMNEYYFIAFCDDEQNPVDYVSFSYQPIQPNSKATTEIRSAEPTDYVNIKYRDTPVNIASPVFEELNTSGSSLVNGAWYDASNEYMVINLNGINYHYCELPRSEWSDFKVADSFGSYYLRYIKGYYDCRVYYMPQYN